eukprot:IDg2891t1
MGVAVSSACRRINQAATQRVIWDDAPELRVGARVCRVHAVRHAPIGGGSRRHVPIGGGSRRHGLPVPAHTRVSTAGGTQWQRRNCAGLEIKKASGAYGESRWEIRGNSSSVIPY